MKISIITVTYNSSKHITSAIQSVLAQSYPNIEYILIDGASTDNTMEIVDQFRNRIQVVSSEKDRGMYDAINKGIALATGDIVGLLHSDDMLEEKDTVANIVECFGASKADFVYGDLMYVNKRNINQVIRYWKSGSFSRKKLMLGWMPPHPTVYVRRELLQNNGDYDLTFSIAADYDWMLRLLTKKIKVAYLPKVLVRMRMGGASNKSLGNILVKMNDDLRALHKNSFGGWYTLLFKNLRKLNQFTQNPSVPEHFSGKP